MNIFKWICQAIRMNWDATLELNRIQQENRRVRSIDKAIKGYDKKIKIAKKEERKLE